MVTKEKEQTEINSKEAISKTIKEQEVRIFNSLGLSTELVNELKADIKKRQN